ncbi:dystrotelin-like [Eleginops maclovinus]
MFRSVGQEVPGHVTLEETCSLMFLINDRSGSGFISSASLQTSLIALSAETLHRKYTALVGVAQRGSGFVSRSGLKALLQDLSQVPAALQEEGSFGDVEAAVSSCFDGVRTGSRLLIGGRHGDTASREHVLSWLRGEPLLLLWLPTLYRLFISQDVRHAVCCHTCKTRPFTGLRYRCMKCVNVHLCQSCYLTDKHTRKHKTHHPVLEFCSQPTWRESLSSLAHSARYTLLPQRQTQRMEDRMQGLEWARPQDSPPPLSEDSVSQDASVHPPICSSKALQTEEEPPQLKASVLLTEVRNLQRDKW